MEEKKIKNTLPEVHEEKVSELKGAEEVLSEETVKKLKEIQKDIKISDEDIEKGCAMFTNDIEELSQPQWKLMSEGFIAGAKWLRDKMKVKDNSVSDEEVKSGNEKAKS